MVNYNIQAGAVANYLWGPICFPCLYLWSLENFRQIKSWHEITPGEDKLRLAWVGWTRGRGGPGIVSSEAQTNLTPMNLKRLWQLTSYDVRVFNNVLYTIIPRVQSFKIFFPAKNFILKTPTFHLFPRIWGSFVMNAAKLDLVSCYKPFLIK